MRLPPLQTLWLACHCLTLVASLSHSIAPKAPVVAPRAPENVAALLDSVYGEHKQRLAVAAIALGDYMTDGKAPRTHRWRPATDEEKQMDRMLTYGEFDLDFLKLILDKHDPGPGTRFMDIGSGTGRCTLAAALLRPAWALCTGLEILPEMTAYAREVHAALLSSCGSSCGAQLARCEFVTADMYSDGGDAAPAAAAEAAVADSVYTSGDDAPAAQAVTDSLTRVRWEDYDLLFAYSTAWPSDAGDSPLYLRRLSRALATRLTVGAVVVTVDKRLRAEDGFELVMAYEGENRETGESTAYVHAFRGAPPASSSTE